jgi:hypothetical protein
MRCGGRHEKGIAWARVFGGADKNKYSNEVLKEDRAVVWPTAYRYLPPAYPKLVAGLALDLSGPTGLACVVIARA